MLRLRKNVSKAVMLSCAALSALSCNKEEPDLSLSDGDAVVFRVSDMCGSKAPVPVTELESFYVTATSDDGVNPRETLWTNSLFCVTRNGCYTGGRFWPAIERNCHFYGCNMAMSSDVPGTVIVDGIDRDVVCAYLDEPVYKEINKLTFKHVLSRIGRLDLSAVEAAASFGRIKFTVKCHTSGRYDIENDKWHPDGELRTIVLNPDVDNDIWIVPGIYDSELELVNSFGETLTFSGRALFESGFVNKVICNLVPTDINISADKPGEMYVAQTVRLTANGDGLRSGNLHWSVSQTSSDGVHSDVVRLTSTTGESVTVECLHGGEAVVTVTDGVSECPYRVTVLQQDVRMSADVRPYADFSWNVPVSGGKIYLPMNGNDTAFKWAFYDREGRIIPKSDFDAQLYEELLVPTISVEKLPDLSTSYVVVTNVNLSSDSAAACICTLHGMREVYDRLGSFNRLTTSGGIETPVDEAVRVGNISAAFVHLPASSGNPDCSLAAYVLLPKVAAVHPEKLIFDNWRRCKGNDGSGIFHDTPLYADNLMTIVNASGCGLQIPQIIVPDADWSETEVPFNIGVDIRDNSVSIDWSDNEWNTLNNMNGTIPFSIECYNRRDRSTFTVAEMSYKVVLHLGVKLMLRKADGIWRLIPTAYDDDTSLYHIYDCGRDIRQFLRWNADFGDYFSQDQLEDRVYNLIPGQLGGALNLSVIDRIFPLDGPELKDGLFFAGDYRMYIPHSDSYEPFVWAYDFAPQLEWYNPKSKQFVWMAYNEMGEDHTGYTNVRFVDMMK